MRSLQLTKVEIIGTYSKDGRIVRYLWRVWNRGWWFLDSQVLDIATTEHNVLVDAVGRWNFVGGIALSPLRAKRGYIFECDSRLFGINLVKRTDVSEEPHQHMTQDL
jgi:hypothetical protein